ncbi:MAG: Pr6Pr family membrane protein [Bacilli bacterium]|nr:Pr6Pr family membrane protein [Bacilli bacterium]MBN2697169.1 Pr6Pr family membrane protein [Bacilli bacterium]
MSESTIPKKQLFRLVFAIIALMGIVLNLLYHDSVMQTLAYYTLQSNIVVFILIVYLLLRKAEMNEFAIRLKFIATCGIFVTFVVYNFVLYPSLIVAEDYDVPLVNDLLVHTITPLLMLLDFALFDPKGYLKAKHIFYALTMPVGYFIFSQIYAISGGTFDFFDSTSRYAYFFLDVDSLGWPKVLLYIIGISLFTCFVGYILIRLDNLIHNRQIGRMKQ